MSDLPRLAKSEELLHYVRGVQSCANQLGEMTGRPDLVTNLIYMVRLMDAETVGAAHEFRVHEMGPHYLENFQAEQDGYEAAEKLLRQPILKEEDL
jgi:hypothetical protein